jgi:anthranilate synthase|tara:strand:+ start:462 stop:1757 length:1296 start_codon:yes stop_codon:yes gene_type:complete
VSVVRTVRSLSREEFAAEKAALVLALDDRRGCIFESAYEYPGRYQHWTMGFVDPPVAIEGRGRDFDVTALNARGRVLLGVIATALRECDAVTRLDVKIDQLSGCVATPAKRFTEEERSKQPSIFSVVRAIRGLFAVGPEVDPQIGLYGSFGYDLTFQFESVKLNEAHERDARDRDLLLYLPDAIVVSDGTTQQVAWRIEYDFVVQSGDDATATTITLPRVGASVPFRGVTEGLERRRDHAAGAYAKKVEKAREEFRVGNLFETVLSQVFYEPCAAPPSEIFDRLRERNPSPYMFIINLGDAEHLVGASPEMFVRCETTYSYAGGNMRVETCPISGTIRRGADALEDAERIKEILANKKEESELTMCTDVDRNDKSRVCVPGSVRVVGRRQIEKYSRLIHTVDHVEGILREGFDALDAFLVRAIKLNLMSVV